MSYQKRKSFVCYSAGGLPLFSIVLIVRERGFEQKCAVNLRPLARPLENELQIALVKT